MSGYSYTWSALWSALDWFLNQQREAGDTADADKFRSLPSTQAKRVVNETIRSMVRNANDRYERELIFRFYDPAVSYEQIEHGYLNVDITGAQISGDIFILPTRIHTLHSVLMSTGRWERLYDASQRDSEIYSPAHNEVYNENGWSVDEPMTARVVMYPYPIRDNIAAMSTTGTPTPDADGFVELTFSSAHSLEAGDLVTLAAFTPSTFNGNWYVVHVPSTTKIVVYTGVTTAVTVAGTVALDTDDQIVEVEDDFIEYLQLEVKRRAYDRMGKAISPYEFSRLSKLEAEWVNCRGRVLQRSSAAFRGYGFGK